MTMDDMISHNKNIQAGDEWLRWGVPKNVPNKQVVKIVKGNHDWLGQIGYMIASKINECVIYIPMTKTKGKSTALKHEQLERMGW